MATHTLDFERPLLELERQIDEMKRTAGDTAVDVSKELAALERKLAELRGEIYKNLTPMQRVQVARHPKRPYTLDYVNTVFTDFVAARRPAVPRRPGDRGRVGAARRHERDADRSSEGTRHQGEPAPQLRDGAPGRLPQGAAADGPRREVRRSGDHAGGHAGRLPGARRRA